MKKMIQYLTNSVFDQCFTQFTDDLESNCLSGKKVVTSLINITAAIKGRLNEAGIEKQPYSWKLKQKLMLHFQGRLVFLERRGLSDVCSSAITTGDALHKAAELNEK